MDPTPDKDEPEASLSPRDPAEMSPRERAIWGSEDELDDLGDLDDLEDLDETPPPRGEDPPAKETAEEAQDDLGEIEDLEPDEEFDEGPTMESGEEEPGEELDALEAGLDDDEEIEPQDGGADPELPESKTAEPEAEKGGEKGSPPAVPGSSGSKLSRKDILWMGGLALILLAGAIYAVVVFSRNINTKPPTDLVDFPVKGSNVVVSKIDTFWRTPDRDADKGVRLDAKLIPCATIRIKSDSGSGALRFFFFDPTGRHVGDSVTLEFSNGSFTSTGEAEAEIHCTGGMGGEGDYAAYLTEEVHFWHLEVLEGPGPKAEGSEFEAILKMRISSNRR